MSVEHIHHCSVCQDDILCRVNCDAMEDGEEVCGPCAERRFDEIRGQEVSAAEQRDQLFSEGLRDVKVSEYGVSIETTLPTDTYDVVGRVQRSLMKAKREAMNTLMAHAFHSDKTESCALCYPPPAPPRTLKQTVLRWRDRARICIAEWVGGEALRDKYAEDYDDD